MPTYNYKSKKIVAVISNNLESWQSLNVLGHLSISLGSNKDSDLMGREILKDKEDEAHMGIARFGFIVKKGASKEISDLINLTKKDRSLTVIDFPREMLDTRHDDELMQSMLLKGHSDFEYLGALIYGDANTVDLMTKGFDLWS